MAHNLTVNYANSAGVERGADAFGPLAPPSYVNQEDPRVEARRIIDEGSGVSTLLTVYAPGQGGGTTAFGLKFLHDSFERDRGRFPGGYFYVNLAREDPGVAVGHFLDGAAGPGLVRERLGVLVERGVLLQAGSDVQPRYRFTTGRMRSTFTPDSEKPLDTPQRVLTHYYGIAYAAHRQLMPGRWLQRDLDGHSVFPDSARTAVSFESVEEARQALIPERHTVVRVVLEAVAEERYAMAAELCEVLWPFWFLSGYFTDVVDTQVPLVKAVLGTHQVEPARLSRLCVQTAIAYRRDKTHEDARREAERALELAEGAHPLVVFTAYDALGDIEVVESNDDSACELFATARRIIESMDPVDRRALHIAERKEGVSHRRAGRLAEAERLILHARVLLADDDHQNHARTHSATGDLRSSQGRFDDALGEYDDAVRLHRILGDLRRVGDVYVARADAAGKLDGADSPARSAPASQERTCQMPWPCQTLGCRARTTRYSSEGSSARSRVRRPGQAPRSEVGPQVELTRTSLRLPVSRCSR